MSPRRAVSSLLISIAGATAAPAAAHPHVFVDSAVDFVVQEGRRLAELRVTWLFDEFESLYMLSSMEIAPDERGRLDGASREELARALIDWSEDFDGAAHLSVDGGPLKLGPPTGAVAHLIESRIALTFVRSLDRALVLDGRHVEIAVYEESYYYAFSVTKRPQVFGGEELCSAEVVKFEPDSQLAELQSTLAELGREETPEDANVGALFADRIVLTCGS